MFEEKRVIVLDSEEQALMINGLNGFRKTLLEQDMPTEDLEDLMLKVIDAPTASSRTPHRSLLPFGQKLIRSVAPPFPTEPDGSAGAPPRKRRQDREAR